MVSGERASQAAAVVAGVFARAGHQQREAEALAYHAAHHLQRRRAEHHVRREPVLLEDLDEVGAAGLHVQVDHRFVHQLVQRHISLLGQRVAFGQQHIGAAGAHQGLHLQRAVQVVAEQDGQVEAAVGQAVHQFVLLAVVQADADAGKALLEGLEQGGHVQRRHRLEAADVDLATGQLVVGHGVLLEGVGRLQQGLGFFIEALAGLGEVHALGVLADEELHVEGFLQPLPRWRAGR